MDPEIAALKNASTSAQLKAAVDAIPREEKYFTAEIRDAILRQKNLIIDAPSADAVVLFLRRFSRLESQLLRTDEIRDLIIDVLVPKISGSEPVENLGRTIFCITHEHKAASERYSNRKSFSAILDCFPRATTAESVLWMASSINNICANTRGAHKIFNNLPVVEAFSASIPHAT